MKENKKKNTILAEVHILGDLQDAEHLVSELKKKKTLLLLQDAEQGHFYSETKGKMKLLAEKDLAKLEKEHKLVTFSFFTGQKKAEPVTGQKTEIQEPVKEEKMAEELKKEKKGKKEKKDPKVKKEKKEDRKSTRLNSSQ